MAFNPKQYFSNYFKKKKPLSIFFDAVFIVLLLLILIPATRKETMAFFIRMTSFSASTLDTDEQYKVNSETYYWKLYDLEGNEYSYGELSDKPMFVNIWATWCPPCIAELPSIQELNNQYGNDVSFVLVSSEDPQIVKKFAEKHGYNKLPFYFSRYVPKDFETNSIPTTFIINKEGYVLVDKKGAARWNSEKTQTLLEQLIKQ